MILYTYSSDETQALGKRIAHLLTEGDILLLNGDLGAGKTTFTKGLAVGLNISAGKVTSPSFKLMNYYKGDVNLYHFDLYRIEDTEELLELGLDDFLYENGISVIEWSEKLDEMPDEYLEINLARKIDEPEYRQISFNAQGAHYRQLLLQLDQEVFKQ